MVFISNNVSTNKMYNNVWAKCYQFTPLLQILESALRLFTCVFVCVCAWKGGGGGGGGEAFCPPSPF